MAREQRMDGYAIKNQKGEFIGLDMASGGYPWIPDNMTSVHIWPSEEKANDYKRIMSSGSSYAGSNPATQWKVVRVILMEV